MPNKLKPCPFCGGKARIVDFMNYDYEKRFEVCCSNMDCFILPHTRESATKQKAIEAWNRRAGRAPRR